MNIDFDITSAPPGPERIAAVRAALAAERLRLRAMNKRFLIVAAATVAAILCFIFFVAVPLVKRPDMEGSVIFVIVYAVPYLYFAVFAVGNTLHHDKVEVPRKALDAVEEALEEGAPEDVEALGDAFQAHAPLGAYRRQVQSQGRALFKGELEAMRRWLEEHAGVTR